MSNDMRVKPGDPEYAKAMRDAFEDEVFRVFFIKSIKKDPKKQFMDCTNVSKAELCERDEDGDYKREDVSAMWFGWTMHDAAEHKMKYPGLTEVGLRGMLFPIHSDNDIPTRPTMKMARELGHVGQLDEGNWLKGALWSHERWLRALKIIE